MRTFLVLAILAAIVLAAWHFIIREQLELYYYPVSYSEIVERCSDEFDVPPYIIFAVIRTESSFVPDAVSHAGAKGLMQLMDETNEWIAFATREDAQPERIFEPAFNIRRGTWLLSYLYGEFGDWSVAYAAYNAGIGRVQGWLADARYSSDGATLTSIPIAETRAYVEKVSEAAEKYRTLYYS